MNPSMTPNLLTVWRAAEEGRSSSWERVGAMRCRWDESRETDAGTSGDTAAWSVEIILPCVTDEPPLLRGDRVALGMRLGDDPAADALAVVNCHPVHLGGAHPHHWEAVAR